LRTALLAGAASIGIAISGAASAQTVHVMNVAVPGGGVAQIHYVGDVPPQIVFAPAPAAFPGAYREAFGAWMPVSSVFGGDSPFAMMDRIGAEMDRRAAVMFRYAEAMTARADAGGIVETAGAMSPGATPFGSASYSFVSTMSGNGVCSQSVRIVSRGDGTEPLVERHSSGNCGDAGTVPRGRSAVQPASPVPAAMPKQPDLILTQGTGSPYNGMARQVASVR
jgi:hypothetical protein